MQIPNEKQAYLCGLAAVLLWSSVATGFKLGLAQLSIDQLLLLGSSISWLIFTLYAGLSGKWRLHRRDWGLAIMLGIINPWAYYLVLFGAYDRLPAHIAQPLNYTWAITLALLAVPLLKQPLSRRMLAGICISYLGVVVLLVMGYSQPQAGWNWLGIILALSSTLLWATYWLINTRSESPPPALMFWSFTAGLPLVALTCWLGSGWPDITPTTILYGAWVGVIEMGVTFILWQRALRLTQQAARIGQLIFLSPFLSLILIWYVLDEQISPWSIVALAIIVLGMRIAPDPAKPPGPTNA